MEFSYPCVLMLFRFPRVLEPKKKNQWVKINWNWQGEKRVYDPQRVRSWIILHYWYHYVPNNMTIIFPDRDWKKEKGNCCRCCCCCRVLWLSMRRKEGDRELEEEDEEELGRNEEHRKAPSPHCTKLHGNKDSSLFFSSFEDQGPKNSWNAAPESQKGSVGDSRRWHENCRIWQYYTVQQIFISSWTTRHSFQVNSSS